MDNNEFEKPIPVYHAKDDLEPKQIYISSAGMYDSPYSHLIEEYKKQRGLRAKLPLYNDVMTADGLMLLTNEEVEKIADKFNSIGCTSFMLTTEQVESLLEQFEKENTQ